MRLSVPLTKLGSFTDCVSDVRSRTFRNVHQCADQLTIKKLRHKHFFVGYLDQLRIAIRRRVNILAFLKSKLLCKSSDVCLLLHHNQPFAALAMDFNIEAILEFSNIFDAYSLSSLFLMSSM